MEPAVFMGDYYHAVRGGCGVRDRELCAVPAYVGYLGVGTGVGELLGSVDSTVRGVCARL